VASAFAPRLGRPDLAPRLVKVGDVICCYGGVLRILGGLAGIVLIAWAV
jgi:hypothetical protein